MVRLTALEAQHLYEKQIRQRVDQIFYRLQYIERIYYRDRRKSKYKSYDMLREDAFYLFQAKMEEIM